MNIKNEFRYILLSFLVGFSFMNSAFADGLEFSVTGTSDSGEVVVGEQVSIKVSLKSSSYINACTFKITNDNTLEAVSKSGMNNYNVLDGNDGVNVENASLDGSPLSNGVNVLELKYKVNGDGKVTIKTVECISPLDEKTGSYQDVVVNIKSKEKVEDTTLSNIVVDGGMLTNFSPDNLTPLIILDRPNFSLKFTTSNPEYQDKIDVTDSLGRPVNASNLRFDDSSGQGIMTIIVTVNNSTKYELGIRYVAKELDNSLASLKVNGQTINLKDGVVEYKVNIKNDVSNVEIEATLKDSENFKFAEGNGPGSFSSNSGFAALIIEPKDSHSGAIGITYTIEIIKEGADAPSSKPSTVKPSESSSNNQVITNPQTGEISMFFMAIVLVASLIGSVYLYKRNVEGYK